MKKILYLVLVLLFGAFILFGCSNNNSNNVGGSNTSTINDSAEKSVLDSKLVDIYLSSKETQKQNKENNVWGEDDAKFDSEGRLWVKCFAPGDMVRETHEMFTNYTYTIYKSEKDYIVYLKYESTNMNTDLVVSTEYYKYEYNDDNFDRKDITSGDFEKIQNEFENMKDYYEELASGNVLSNKSPSNTKLNKLETVNKSTGDVHYKYGNVIKVLKVIDIGDYKIDNLYSLSKDQYRLVFNDEYKNHFLDLKGNISINEKWKNYKIYNIVNSELAIVQDEESKKYGIIDKNGNYVLNPDYSHIHSQDGGKYYFVVKNDKLNMLDNVFNKMFECDYYEFKPINVGNNKVGQITNYYNDLLNIFNGNKWGYLDLKGNVVIDYKYDIAGAFNKQGYSSVVSKNINGENKYGLIDKNDNIIIDFQYDKYLSFGVDGISRANKDDEAYYIIWITKKCYKGYYLKELIFLVRGWHSLRKKVNGA